MSMHDTPWPALLRHVGFARITVELQAVTPIHIHAKIPEQPLHAVLLALLHDEDCPNRVDQSQACHPGCLYPLLAGGQPRPDLPFDLCKHAPASLALDFRVMPGTVVHVGETVELEFVFIGAAIEALPRVLEALRRAGQQGLGYRRGQFVIGHVRGRTPIGEEYLSIPGYGPGLMAPHRFSWEDCTRMAALLSADGCVVSLLKPLRAFWPGTQALLDDLPCVEFVRVCWARLRALAFAHGDRSGTLEDEIAFKDWKAALLAQAADVRHLRLLTPNWHERRRLDASRAWISGITAAYLYTGSLACLLPVLLAGSILQVGKAVSFGNGAFKLDHPSFAYLLTQSRDR